MLRDVDVGWDSMSHLSSMQSFGREFGIRKAAVSLCLMNTKDNRSQP